MKAAVLQKPSELRVVAQETPVPGPGEILLKVQVAALCGTDMRMWRSGAKSTQGQILGHEFAGVIETVGTGVEPWRAGDRVCVAPNIGCGICDFCVAGLSHMCLNLKAIGIHLPGSFAEYVLLPKGCVSLGNLVKLPDDVSFEAGALCEPLSCVYNGFESLEIGPGDSVLVIGAGPIGAMHAMLARMAGAAQVMVTDLSKDRLIALQGATGIQDIYAGDNLKGYIMDQTRGRGVNALVTACPAPSAQSGALALMAPFGRINFFGGLPSGQETVTINTNLIHYNALTLTGTTRATHAQYRKCLQLIASGLFPIDRLITTRSALEDIQAAFEYAATAGGLKSVITF